MTIEFLKLTYLFYENLYFGLEQMMINAGHPLPALLTGEYIVPSGSNHLLTFSQKFNKLANNRGILKENFISTQFPLF